MNFQPGWIESAEFANVSSSQQSKSHPDPTVNSLYSNPERRYFSGRDIDYAKFVHYSGVISPEQVLPGDDARYSKEKIHVDQWPLPEDLCPLTQPESKVLESQQATGPSDALLTMLDDSNIIFQFDLDESFDAINKNLSENFQTLVESVTDEVDWNNFGDDYRQLTSAIRKGVFQFFFSKQSFQSELLTPPFLIIRSDSHSITKNPAA